MSVAAAGQRAEPPCIRPSAQHSGGPVRRKAKPPGILWAQSYYHKGQALAAHVPPVPAALQAGQVSSVRRLQPPSPPSSPESQLGAPDAILSRNVFPGHICSV